MDKKITKEQLETMFGIKFFDHEVELFNTMLEARKKGEKIITYPARQSARTHKVSRCFDLYETLQSRIKVNPTFYNEFIGGKE